MRPGGVMRGGGLVAVASGLLAALSCTNSGLGLEDTTRPVDTDTTEVVVACPYVGTWALTEVSCGTFAIVDWFGVYAQAQMVVTDPGDATCAAAFSWSGAACAETEAWAFDAKAPIPCAAEPAEGDPTQCYEVAAEGITSCAPEACVFDLDGDAACAVGDRAAAFPVAVNPREDGQLAVEGLLVGAWPACPLEMRTTWTRQ